MRIPCPTCGERSGAEFTYLGDARPERPANEAPLEAWHGFVFLRENPKGPLDELWHHTQGCRGWLVVKRDTATHEVFGSVSARAYARGERP